MGPAVAGDIGQSSLCEAATGPQLWAHSVRLLERRQVLKREEQAVVS